MSQTARPVAGGLIDAIRGSVQTALEWRRSYGYNEMLVLNMVKARKLGRLTHGECAYIHDLRELLLSDEGEGLWRRYPHLQLDGNLYPTHGLGPVANYLAINRGDRFEYLVSMSGLEAGLTEYRDEHLAPSDPKRQERYRTGDMNTSLIRTALAAHHHAPARRGEPPAIQTHNMISGTKGTFADYPPRIMLEGQPEGEKWAGLDAYKAEFESPLWARVGELARKLGGHGGMDFIMNYRMVQCLREGLVPDRFGSGRNASCRCTKSGSDPKAAAPRPPWSVNGFGRYLERGALDPLGARVLLNRGLR